MKKIILLFLFTFMVQLNHAQIGKVTPKVKEFVQLQGIAKQLDQVKESISNVVEESSKKDFLSDFDNVVKNTINKIEEKVGNTFSEKELDSAIEGLKADTEFEGLSKERADFFQDSVNELTKELTTEINALVLKYGKPELFE